jgi:hypothetical protein
MGGLEMVVGKVVLEEPETLGSACGALFPFRKASDPGVVFAASTRRRIVEERNITMVNNGRIRFLKKECVSFLYLCVEVDFMTECLFYWCKDLRLWNKAAVMMM